MSNPPARLSVMKRAQELLRDDSLLSSPESHPHERRPQSGTRMSQTRVKITESSDIHYNPRLSEKFDLPVRESHQVNRSFAVTKRSSSKKPSNINKSFVIESDHHNHPSHNPNHNHQHSHHARNRSSDIRNSTRTSKKLVQDLVKQPTCQQEKYQLKSNVNDLQHTVVKQSKKLKTMYKRIMEKRKEVNQLTEQLFASRKKTGLVLELEEKVKGLEENELNLLNHLKDQRKVAKEALHKLYELQDESIAEIEKAKKHYKAYYQKQVDEAQEEKERLLNVIRDLETELDNERKSEKVRILTNENSVLKSQVSEKALENERLKFEIKDLKQEHEDHRKEVLNLRNEIEELAEQNRKLRANEEEHYNRELHANIELRKTVKTLERQLLEKDRTGAYDKDSVSREQVTILTQKIEELQDELKKQETYDDKVRMLTKELQFKDEELQSVTDFYKDKMQKAKVAQREQKNEWTNIYNELLTEIKQLKNEIDSLSFENKKLMSSIRSKSRDKY